MSAPGMPSGRQRAGLLGTLFRNNPAASGRMGASAGLKSAKMFQKYLEKVLGSSPGTTKGLTSPNKLASSPGAASSGCHTPERSGLPLIRGAGAERLGLPSLVRGVRGSG